MDVQHIDDRTLCCGTPPGKRAYDTIPEHPKYIHNIRTWKNRTVISFLQIVNGRHAQATRVLHPLIGVAVVSAGLPKESLKYIDVVKKTLKHFGALPETGRVTKKNLP